MKYVMYVMYRYGMCLYMLSVVWCGKHMVYCMICVVYGSVYMESIWGKVQCVEDGVCRSIYCIGEDSMYGVGK